MLFEARRLFLKVFPNKKIDSLEFIPRGYSNKTFRVVSEGECFKVRIACNNDIIDRNNEYLILRAIKDKDCYFYDRDSGNGVWKWIEGSSISKEKLTFSVLSKLCKEIKKIHDVPKDKLHGILNHNDLEFLESNNCCLEDENLELYKQLVDKNKNDPRNLCHNDISFSNILYDEEKDEIHLIDYEWGRINSRYWDYGNFVKESDLELDFVKDLSIFSNLDFQKLLEYCFMASVYSLQLSYSFPESNSLNEYRNRVRNLIFKYRGWLKM